MSSNRVSLPGTPTLATPLSSTSTTTQVNAALYSAQVKALDSAFQVVSQRYNQVKDLQDKALDAFLSKATDAQLGIPPPSPRPVFSPTADLDAALAGMTDADLGIPTVLSVGSFPPATLTPDQYYADWDWPQAGYVSLTHFAHLLPSNPQYFRAELVKKDGEIRSTTGLALGLAAGKPLMRVLDLRQKVGGPVCGMIKHFRSDLQTGVTFYSQDHDAATRMPLSGQPARPEDRFA